MAKATGFKFYAPFGQEKCYTADDQPPLSGRGQNHVTPSRISHPWNISGMAEARVVKFCVLAVYVKW